MAIFNPPNRGTSTGGTSLTGSYVTIDTDQIITGDKTFAGDVTFNGTVLNNLVIEDNIITINSGETAAGVNAGSAGIEVDRGTSNPAKLLFTENVLGVDNDNRWVIDIGDGSQEQIIYDNIPDDISFNGKLTVNNDIDVNFDLAITSLAGNTDEIVTLAADGTLQNSGVTVASLSGGSGDFVLKSGDTMTGNLSVPTVNITGYASFTSKVSGEVPWEEGRVFYCDGDKTLCYFNDNDKVKVNIGQETIIRVTNRTGTAIEDGKVVYISGAFAGGNRVTINLADATLGFAKVIGVTTCDIPDSQIGYVTTEGLVKNINTSSFTVGDELYLDPNNPGELTNVMPISPNKKIRIGFVTKVGTTDGIIFAKVFNGNELSQLHDVTTTSPISGDLITWDGEKWTNEYNINTLGITSGLQGRLPLNDTDKIYTITHPEIDPNEEYPVVSLDIPTSGSDLFVQGVYDRQAESFKVELSGIPNSSYGILWHISTQETSNGGSDNLLSYFDPFVIDSTPELVNISGSQYYTEIRQSYGNLIAIDANVITYAEIEVRISSEWTTSQVGTFRLDLDVKSGQTFTFDNSIDGINDVTLPDISGAASLLFDKPYGTSTWYVRQNI